MIVSISLKRCLIISKEEIRAPKEKKGVVPLTLIPFGDLKLLFLKKMPAQ